MAFVGLFLALSMPNQLVWVSPAAFIYFPLELSVIALLLLLPGRSGSSARVFISLLLGIAMLLRAADLLSHEILGRPFDLIFDSHLLADGGNVLSGALGDSASLIIGLGLAGLSALLCWLAFAMLGRLQRVLQRHKRASVSIFSLLLLAWGILEMGGWSRTGSFTVDQLVWHGRDTLNSMRDIRQFANTVDDDMWSELDRDTPMFNRLQGKDVFVVFAESYGRVLLEREPFAESVTAKRADTYGGGCPDAQRLSDLPCDRRPELARSRLSSLRCLDRQRDPVRNAGHE